MCLHCLTVSTHASASAKIASGIEIQLKLNANGIGQIFVLLLHSSILAHVLNELCKAVMKFLTTLLVLGLNTSIMTLTVPAFGFFPNSNVVYRTEGLLSDLGFSQVFNGDKESFKCRLYS